MDNDLISRSVVLERLDKVCVTDDGFGMGVQFGVDHAKDVVKVVPIIDPESLRPKGTWVGEADGYADGELVYDVWYCSECNHCIDDGTDDPEMLPNYCPNCGAKMEVL